MADYSPLVSLAVFIFLGFILRYGKLLKDENIQALPAVLLNAAYPALVVSSITSVDIRSLAGESVLVVVCTLVITLVLYWAGRIGARFSSRQSRKPLILFSLGIGNIVYVVLPIVKVLFGELGVYYAMLHATTQDILIWTIYYQYFSSDAGRERFRIRHLATPCFGALVVALIVAVSSWTLPPFVRESIDGLASMTIPLALIYLGGVLAGFGNLKAWLPDRMTVLLSVFKVLLLPMIVFGGLLMVPMNQSLRVQLSLFFASPATIMSTVWARQFNCDYQFAIRVLFFSTVLFFSALFTVLLISGSLERSAW